MSRALLIGVALCTLTACASGPGRHAAKSEGPALTEAARVEPLPQGLAAQVLTPPRPATGPGQAAVRAPQPAGRPGARPLSPHQALAAANQAARQTPLAGAFEDATLVYAYEPGALYELHTTPAFISTLVLEPGETLADVAAGDTSRWMVSHTVAGSGEQSRTLVMVKPHAPGLRTNLVLITNRRAYLIEALSAPGDAYTAQVAWRYPAPPVPLQLNEPDPTPRPIFERYRIRPPHTGAPPWTPVRVYDDGARTVIEFPAESATTDLPPLFVRTAEGQELVNYRVQGQRYVVDRLFEVAELRLGQADPVVVRIERQRPNHRLRIVP